MRTKRIISLLTAMASACSSVVPQIAQCAEEIAVKEETASETIYADANESGSFNIADAVAILQYIANMDKYPLTKQGKINADIVDPGEGVTGLDALAIQMLDAGILRYEELPITHQEMTKRLHKQDSEETTEAPSQLATEVTTEDITESTTEPSLEDESEKEEELTAEEIFESLSDEYKELYLSNPYAVISAEKKIPIIYGDLAEDMHLDSIDLSVLKRAVLNEAPYDEKADLDGDKDVDGDDVKLLQSFILAKTRCFPVYSKYDSDNDGINDYLEMEYFRTDSRKADTDGDGLTDYEEIVYTFTDPKVAESVTDGVSDADIDSDDDGVSNIDELNMGSSPSSNDSDMDGLDDGYEVNVLKTSPVKADTDEDGLNDYEENELGLDPLNPATDGTPDSERILRQVIPADDPILREINTADNAYVLSVEIDASGYAKNCLTVRDSSYAYVLQDSSAIGATPEFIYDDNYKVESITLKFEIKEAFCDNVSHYFDILNDGEDYYDYKYQVDPELDGIKRLNVFKFFESISLPMPISTDYDIDNNVVSVTVDTFETDENGNPYGIGSYSLVDLEVWGKIMNGPEAETTGSDLVTDAQGFVRKASDVQIGADGVTFITKAIKKIDDTIRDAICRNYQSFNARQATRNAEKLNSGSEPVASLFGHKYAYYESSGISWSEAATACRAKGGHLITVTSPFEYSFLSGTLSSGRSGLYWVGASGTPGNWSWLTDESISYVRTISAYGYTIDSCGTYFSNLGDHLAYCPGLAYDTENCPTVSGVKGYICEWEPGALINDADSGLFSVNMCGSSVAMLKALLSASSSADSDNDGIPDWKEINHDAIIRLGGKTSDAAVSWKNAQQYINTTKKLAGKATDKLVKKIGAVFDGKKSVTPVSSSLVSDDSDGDGYKDSMDPRPNSNDIIVKKLSQDYIAVDYSKADPAEKDTYWANHSAPSGSEHISYGGNQGWFRPLVTDIPDDGKRNLIADQGCGLIAMADLALYLSRRDPSTYSNSVTKIASVANPIDFNLYKKYVLDFEKKYVNLHVPSLELSFVQPGPIMVPGLGVNYNTINVDINYGDMIGINSNDGNMGKILTKYFKDNDIKLKASWCILDDSITTTNIWSKRIKNLISRDIPAIIAIGPSNGDEKVPFYDLKSKSIDRVASFEQSSSVDNHYFNVTAVIEDRVKKENGYWNGVMYEVSSWGDKYYMSEKQMDDFIHEHSSLFTNVVYIEEK